MSACFQPETIRRLSDASYSDFDARVKETPEALCAPFREHAGKLLEGLVSIYRMVVMACKAEEDINVVASFWREMVASCDKYMIGIEELCKAHPYCSAGDYRDKVLDLRNTCQRLQTLHS